MTRDSEVMARALIAQAHCVIETVHNDNPLPFTERWLRIANRFMARQENFDLTAKHKATLELLIHEDGIQ
jgi:hypothetical protein